MSAVRRSSRIAAKAQETGDITDTATFPDRVIKRRYDFKGTPHIDLISIEDGQTIRERDGTIVPVALSYTYAYPIISRNRINVVQLVARYYKVPNYKRLNIKELVKAIIDAEYALATAPPPPPPIVPVLTPEEQKQQETFKRLDSAHDALSDVWMRFDEAYRALTLLRNNPDASKTSIQQITPNVEKYLNKLISITHKHSS